MSDTQSTDASNRCRLVLIMDGATTRGADAALVERMGQAGDIASIIFTGDGLEEPVWQAALEPLVAAAQARNIACIIDTNSRIAGRVKADGLQLGQDPQQIEEAVEKYTPQMMVGAANVKTRHNALVLGELQPDYVMFGKPGGDTRPEPHPKNLDLGQWWAAMVEIPGIVLGGTRVDSVVDVAKTGTDFVALGAAIFVPQEESNEVHDPAALVARANALLDANAPRFDSLDETV
ncbi:MAG: thiamine phosphate synthase [Pseudomonadota bacterium]